MSLAVIASDTQALLWRWLIHAKRDIMSLTVGLIQPLIWLFFFGGLMRGVFSGGGGGALGVKLPEGLDYMSFYVSGVIAFTLLTNAVLGGIPIVFDRENGFIDKILSAPISRISIVLSRFIYVTGYSLAQAFLVLGASVLMGVRFQGDASAPIALLGVAGYGALLAAGVTALSLGLAFKAPHHAVFFTITGFVLTPFVVLSSAFVPLERIPEGWMRLVATWNPMTHTIDPIRALICGRAAVGGDPAYAFHALVLAGFDVLCLAWAVRAIRQRLD